MKDRPMGFQKVPLTPKAVQLPPRAATGMTIGPQIVQPQPTAIGTSGVGTKMHRGVHRSGAAVRARHGLGPDRRRWMGFPGLLVTQHTVRLVRQPLKRFGLVSTLALGRGRHGWGGLAWLGPREMQHDEEPHENA